MNEIIYIGSFSRLIRISFGDKIQGDFITEKLPFIIYDYDEMKRQCSDVCAKVNYEYVDEHLYLSFVKKWQKRLQHYNQRQYALKLNDDSRRTPYVIKSNGYNSEKYN